MTPKKLTTVADGVHVEWLKNASMMTLEGLSGFIYKIVRGDFEYDDQMRAVAIATCCLAACNAAQRSLAAKGQGKPNDQEQVMWQLIEAFTRSPEPKRLQSFGDLLYPERKPGIVGVPAEIKKWLMIQATNVLATNDGRLSYEQREHLESVARGELPWGLEEVLPNA